MEFFNEALKSPNHKIGFSFTLGSLQVCLNPSHFPKLADLKALLKNSTAKSIKIKCYVQDVQLQLICKK